MTKRRLFWLLIGLLVVAVLLVLVPSSPLYAPHLFARYAHYHDGQSLGYWMDALDSSDTNLRKRAIFSIGTIGADGREAIPAVSRIMLEDRDPDMRRCATQSLLKMMPASVEAVPALAQALSDEEPWVRMYAAITLFRLGNHSHPAIPALLDAIKQERNDVILPQFTQSIQEMAILALGRAGGSNPQVAEALTDSLENAQSDRVRLVAIRALGDLGLKARPAVPELQKLLKHDNEDVRQLAAATLHKIDG